MQRSIVGALLGRDAGADSSVEVSNAASSRRLPRWLLAVGFWTLVVLIYSTRMMRIAPSDWIPISWFESLKIAAAQWYTWGLLSFGIYWVNRKLPFGKDALFRRLLCHVPLSLVFTVVYTYLNFGATRLLGTPHDLPWLGPSLLETLTRAGYRLGTFVYWSIAATCMALDYQSDLQDREVRAAELERLLTEARLATLRSQLDPHFLFNALNSISAYVESAPRKARLMIEQLGDLLRLSLEHADEQEVTLERELMFVDRYIQLQLARFADRLDVRVRVNDDVLTAAVPTFMLQPLVENAIRHGVSKLPTLGTIELSAWRTGESLRVRVRDNGPGLPPGWTLDQHMGVGLGNTRARLEQLYGKGAYSLEVRSDAEAGTCADVTIPYRAGWACGR
jgi:two-component system, LytTR family, sensor kinase